MRMALIITIGCLLWATPAGADEGRLPTHDDLELLPIPEHVWEGLAMRHRALIEALEEVGGRLEELDEGDENQKLARKVLQARAAKLSGQLREAFVTAGVNEAAWARATSAPRGPRRAARFAHAQVLAVVPAGHPSRALLTQLVPAVDVAQRVLAQQRETMEEKLEDSKLDREKREELLESFERRIEFSERRFWRVVDCVVDDVRKASIRARLPAAFHTWDDPLQHAMRLPGATVSQISRLRALEKEIEAESAADESLIQRNERIADDESKPDTERESAHEQIAEAAIRLAELHGGLYARMQRYLTPEQWKALLAIPPRVEVQDRDMPPHLALGQVEFDDAQFDGLFEVHDAWRALYETVRPELEALGRKAKDAGPDSPQMQGMEMASIGIQARITTKILALMSRVLLTVLRAEQVVEWVLAVPDDE